MHDNKPPQKPSSPRPLVRRTITKITECSIQYHLTPDELAIYQFLVNEKKAQSIGYRGIAAYFPAVSEDKIYRTIKALEKKGWLIAIPAQTKWEPNNLRVVPHSLRDDCQDCVSAVNSKLDCAINRKFDTLSPAQASTSVRIGADDKSTNALSVCIGANESVNNTILPSAPVQHDTYIHNNIPVSIDNIDSIYSNTDSSYIDSDYMLHQCGRAIEEAKQPSCPELQTSSDGEAEQQDKSKQIDSDDQRLISCCECGKAEERRHSFPIGGNWYCWICGYDRAERCACTSAANYRLENGKPCCRECCSWQSDDKSMATRI